MENDQDCRGQKAAENSNMNDPPGHVLILLGGRAAYINALAITMRTAQQRIESPAMTRTDSPGDNRS
jgi:hypothetical protein